MEGFLKNFDTTCRTGKLYAYGNFLFAFCKHLNIYSIANKENPSFIGSFPIPREDDYTPSLIGTYKDWVFFYGADGLYLINLSNPLEPRMIKSTCRFASDVYPFKDEYFFISSHLDGSIYYSSQLPELTKVGSIPEADHFLYKDSVFCTSRNGMSVVDLSNPTDPKVLSHPIENIPCGCMKLYHEDTVLIRTSDSIVMMDITRPERPKQIARMQVEGNVYSRNFYTSYPYIVVKVPKEGLKVFKSVPPDKPRLVFTYPLLSNIVVHQGRFFAAWEYPQWLRGKPLRLKQTPLEVLMITESGKIKKVLSHQHSEEIYAAIFVGNTLYVATENGLCVGSLPQEG